MKNRIAQLGMVFLTLCVMTSCKEKTANVQPTSGYTITGTVKGIDNVYIKMRDGRVPNEAEPVLLDSTLISNGRFSFTGEVDHVDMVDLSIANKYHGSFMLENSAITMDIDVTDLEERNTRFTPTVTGSASHDKFAAVQAKTEAVFSNEEYKAVNEKLRKAFADAKESDRKEDMDKALAMQEEYQPIMSKIQNQYKQIKYDYARNNPSSPVAVYVLGFQYSEGRMSRENLKEFYNLFEGEARETSLFKNYITKIYKDNFETLSPGNGVPDFTLKTVDGEDLTLTDVTAKYKLIDFWASWCVPCRASFPHLKELRKQYAKDGFKIVGIGTADEEAKWRNAIKEDQTPWIHVYDPSENHAYGEVAQSYGVPFLPTTFLVDENNVILLRNPSKEELDATLKEVFGH